MPYRTGNVRTQLPEHTEFGGKLAGCISRQCPGHPLSALTVGIVKNAAKPQPTAYFGFHGVAPSKARRNSLRADRSVARSSSSPIWQAYAS
jgi:hypothetical protein